MCGSISPSQSPSEICSRSVSRSSARPLERRDCPGVIGIGRTPPCEPAVSIPTENQEQGIFRRVGLTSVRAERCVKVGRLLPGFARQLGRVCLTTGVAQHLADQGQALAEHPIRRQSRVAGGSLELLLQAQFQRFEGRPAHFRE